MANDVKKVYYRGPFTDEEKAGLREVLESYERRRWLREKAAIWIRVASAVVPIASFLYLLLQGRGGR